jgi:hypothetical protein
LFDRNRPVTRHGQQGRRPRASKGSGASGLKEGEKIIANGIELSERKKQKLVNTTQQDCSQLPTDLAFSCRHSVVAAIIPAAKAAAVD